MHINGQELHVATLIAHVAAWNFLMPKFYLNVNSTLRTLKDAKQKVNMLDVQCYEDKHTKEVKSCYMVHVHSIEYPKASLDAIDE